VAVKIQYRYPTEQDIIDLAHNMRDNDIQELCAVTDLSPLAAVKASVGLSHKDYLYAASVNGELLCIGGACDSFEQTGIPWLLATRAMHKYNKLLTKEAKRCLPLMQQKWPVLTNLIDQRSTKNIKWLLALGFELKETYEIKPGMPVVRFEMRGNYV